MPSAGGSSGGGLTVLRNTVRYSDFPPPVLGNSFAPVHTLSVGDVVLRAGWVCTQTFNDSNHGALAFQLTDADNGFALGGLVSGGTANASSSGGVSISPMEFATGSIDSTGYDSFGANSTQMARVRAGWTIGISDNGTLARNGSAGSFLVVLIVA